MDIKRLASALCKHYKTHDPFKIVDALGYQTVFVPLVDVRGFYQHVKRCHIIYIDDVLEERQARFVCAHELGHTLIHKGMNRIFMDTRTHMATSRYEKEADRFAVDLLFDDRDLHEYLGFSTIDVANHLGISFELAKYRMGSINLYGRAKNFTP